jgi:hypothetical protein
MNKKLRFRKKEQFKLGVINLMTPSGVNRENILAYLDNWQKVDKYFSQYEYHVNNVSIVLEFDWKQCIVAARKSCKVSLLSPEALIAYFRKHRATRRTTSYAHANVVVRGATKKSVDKIFCQYYVENFIYRMFLIMNISAPGAMDFFLTKVLKPNQKWSRENKDEGIRLSSSILDTCWTFTDPYRNHQIPIPHVPLDKVVNWFSNAKLEQRRYAENSALRSLYALLKLSEHEVIGHADIVWQAHAIESLYKNKEESNVPTRILRDRVIKYLEIKDKDIKFFKKRFQEFYDFRHAFVHGSSKIEHPIEWRWLGFDDSGIDRIASSIYYTNPIILRTLQKFVEEGIYSLRFSEEIHPDTG